jgi:hypothetical protein
MNHYQEGNFFWILTIHYKDKTYETHHFMSTENAKKYATEELFNNEECTGCSIDKELFRSFAENLAWRIKEQQTTDDLPF